MRKSLVLILLAFLITWIMQFSSIGFHCSLNHRCNFILLGGGVSLQIPTIVEFDTYVETLVTLHLHQCRLQSSCFFLKIRKQIGSLMRHMGVFGGERKISISPQSHSLHFQPCSRPYVRLWVLQYTKIWTVLQSITNIDLQINLLICKRLNTGEEEKEQTHKKL